MLRIGARADAVNPLAALQRIDLQLATTIGKPLKPFQADIPKLSGWKA